MKPSYLPSPSLYPESIDKEELKTLPRESFSGTIILIEDSSEIPFAIAHLRREPLVGIDTESKPSFVAGRPNKVALLQLSTPDTCYLIRLNKTGLTEEIRAFFEDESILKIGLSLKDDIQGLRKLEKFRGRGFVELQSLAPAYGIKDLSLQKIYGIVFGKYLAKTQRMTNWEAPLLTEKQQEYAALDAWASLRIFEEFMKQPPPHPLNFAIL